VDPHAFVRALCAKLTENSVYVADVGQNQIWSANLFQVKNGKFLTSGGMGTMGYSVPAAVGAKLAAPSRQVVAVCGDGAFQMSMNELGTICQHHVPVKIVVMKNGRLGMVWELQSQSYRSRYSGTLLDGSPDFVALAGAYGIASASIEDDGQVAAAVREMFAHNGPYLLEVCVDPENPSVFR